MRSVAAVGRLLGGRLGGLPDPVVLEMATCHWGLSTLWSHKELDYRPRAPRQTLVDTVHFIRAECPELGARVPQRAVA